MTPSLVSASPLYTRLSLTEVSVTERFAISSLPGTSVTANWLDTSLPLASFTTGVPLMVFAYSPALTAFGSEVFRPSTVYFWPSTVNSDVFNPVAACSTPSYVLPVEEFASTVT